MKNMDDVLYEALSPMEKPSINLNRKILEANKEINMKRIVPLKHKFSLSAAAAIFALVIALYSVTAYAALKYLSAQEVASALSENKLAEGFGSDNLLKEAQTQHFEDYDVTLLGLVSGQNLSEYISVDNGEIISDNTYAAVAISRADGSPMLDTSSDDYGKEDFLVSPYIEGLDPAQYNIFSLNAGGYLAVVENGVQYRIMEVENIEAFADRKIYLGVSDGSFYNSEAYIYDTNTGSLSRNSDYSGVNALFVLPIEASKADQDKANAILEKINNPDEADENELSQEQPADVEEFMAKLTIDNIDEYAEPVESTRQILTPDKDGLINYEYVIPSGGSGNGCVAVDDLFPDGVAGMSDRFGWASSEGLLDLWIETYTLNEDGTVTFVIYVPKS